MSTKLVTSTGHDLSDAGWLDQHFNFSREAYEAMVHWVGFQRGWHVLDAGCGGGGFVPLLAEQVGATGKVSALDLVPENVAAAEARIKSKRLGCVVETRVGSVLSLPYPDHTFDAVWNANVQQYLTDAELRQMLAEFRRVTKPGGLVAVKESHLTGWYDALTPPVVFWRWYDAMCRSGDVEMLGVMRAGELPKRVRAVGMTDIRYKFFGVDKSGPLNSNDRAFRISACKWYAERAERLDLPSEDLELWRPLADAQYVSDKINEPDYFTRAEYVQVVGRVP